MYTDFFFIYLLLTFVLFFFFKTRAGGHEEEMPLDRHLTQIIYKVDGVLQTLDQGVHMARKRGGNVQLELNEGTHTITNTLKVGSGQGEETWKGIVVNFHDLSILGQGTFNNLKKMKKCS